MARIVTVEEKEQIRADYLKFRSAGLTKTEARAKTAEKHDRGVTTIYDNTFDLENPTVDEYESVSITPSWPKTYIITGWEIRVGINDKFIGTLKKMAKEYDAELLLVPCQKSDLQHLPEKLKNTFKLLSADVKFNDNLMFKYVETNALVQSPLAGHMGAYPDNSTIIPGLVKELRTEPSQHYVKQLISTGSVGYLDARFSDYAEFEDSKEFAKKWQAVRTRRHGKGTAIAQNYIQPTALIVDILDRKTFLTRFVTSNDTGVVFDLNKKFTATSVETHQPEALITGDFHAYYVDDTAYKATKDMIRFFNPKSVVLNDFFDGASVNHHELENKVKFHRAPTIKEEADVSKTILKELCRLSNEVVYLQSNHCNFLMKFLDKSETYWRLNRNYKEACELQLYRVQEDKHPIVKLLDLDSFNNLRFVSERENYYVGRVLVKHGHEGIGGGRAGFLGLAKIYNYYAQGHTHVPCVFRNAMCVGLNGRLDMEYVMGANGMMHANGLIHSDGSTQLLPIIYGEWIR